jgi:predicted ATPase
MTVPLSKEVRRLSAKWQTADRWPKRLEWLEIANLRGWSGQRFEMRFPIMAIVGENGAGKSTILQAAASVYGNAGSEPERYASDFFPDTPWDHIRNARIAYSVREGNSRTLGSIRKPTDRWRGNPERPKRRVEYIDLSRIQPVSARLGYVKLANPMLSESSTAAFPADRLARVCEIMGRPYDSARMSTIEGSPTRLVPVLEHRGSAYSGFHQGAGETTVTELLQADIHQGALVLIDEIESSLHPRAQRRLIRDLADKCRDQELQIILTTHSPYVLEELPLEARAYIVGGREATDREIVYGVSPEFAMTRMDESPHPEVEVYVEDGRAERLVVEILAAHSPELVSRCQMIPYGAASVGQALGQMAAADRFPRPSCVFLDADRASSPGCHLLPGDDAPERVVFEGLSTLAWGEIHMRVGRKYADVADALSRVMTMADHHEWITSAGSTLTLDSDTLWQAMAAEWSGNCLSKAEADAIISPISDLLHAVTPVQPRQRLAPLPPTRPPAQSTPVPSEPGTLFEQSVTAAQQ